MIKRKRRSVPRGGGKVAYAVQKQVSRSTWCKKRIPLFTVRNFGHNKLGSVWFSRDASTCVTNRFLAAELIPDYIIWKRVRLGMSLLRGHGFDKGGIKDSYFVGVRSQITNVEILKGLNLRFIPQVYYLKTDDKDGIYATNTLSLAYKGFPLSISSIVNKAIDLNIPGKDVDWNVSLVYFFDRTSFSKKAKDSYVLKKLKQTKK